MPQRRILLFTGNGKGKSTAAFGMLTRALGHGMKAKVIQFVKSDEKVGEQRFFSQLPNVSWEQYGKGFLPRNPYSPQMEEHRHAAQQGFHAAFLALASPEYQFVLLDEICFALSHNLLALEPLLDALHSTQDGKIIVLTGRNAPEALIAVADTVTDMTLVKHAYEQGIQAQKGVEN